MKIKVVGQRSGYKVNNVKIPVFCLVSGKVTKVKGMRVKIKVTKFKGQGQNATILLSIYFPMSWSQGSRSKVVGQGHSLKVKGF